MLTILNILCLKVAMQKDFSPMPIHNGNFTRVGWPQKKTFCNYYAEQPKWPLSLKRLSKK